MTDKVVHLNENDPIVDPATGKPTFPFLRALFDRGGLLQNSSDTLAQILSLNVVAGAGLDGGGTVQDAIDADPTTPEITIDANASAILDLITTTRGSILYRGAVSWSGLAPGTSGYVLTTSGAGTNPAWAAASVADGDKGDITVSSSGTVWTIDNDVVTYAKIQNVSAASKLLGRGDSGSGDTQEITLGSGLTMTGTTLSASSGGSGGYFYEGFGDLTSIAGLTKLSGASANITLTDGTRRHLYSWTSSGANTVQMAYQSATSTPWNVYVRFMLTNTMATNVQFGIALRNSSSGKIFFLALNTNTTITAQEWTNPTTFSSSLASASVGPSEHTPTWLRINSDGTTLTAYYGWNGIDWFTLTARTIATFMSSIDHVGLGTVPQTANSAEVSDFGLVTPA